MLPLTKVSGVEATEVHSNRACSIFVVSGRCAMAMAPKLWPGGRELNSENKHATAHVQSTVRQHQRTPHISMSWLEFFGSNKKFK